MKEFWNKVYNNRYTDIEWRFIKVLFVSFWIFIVFNFSSSYNSIPIPQGICKIIPCELLLSGLPRYLLIFITAIVLILYVLEIHMFWMTFFIFIISTIIFTIEESNGILRRLSLMTFIYFAQFLAYLVHRFYNKSNIRQNRIQFSVQAIVAAYTLSALSKLYESGIYWIVDGKRIPLQILKSYYQFYIDDGNLSILEKGLGIAQFIEEYPIIIYFLLFSTLFLEMFSLIAIINKKMAFIYGIFLLLMHIGIKLVMDIGIYSIAFPMVLFMINPVYLIWLTLKHYLGKCSFIK